MTTWQINIERARVGEPVNMTQVRRELADLIDGIEQINQSGREGDFVYVRPVDIAQAVRRIHALGYTTDEDDD